MAGVDAEIASVVLRCREELRRRGLLLKADARLPSVATLVAGKPIVGSWWGHPKGRVIFHALDRLADDPDVLVSKLVSGKDTFVHRRLWPAVASVAMAHRAASERRRDALSRSILRQVERSGRIDADELRGGASKDRQGATRALLLGSFILSEEYHTATGAHSRRLESWESWLRRKKVGALPAPEEGRDAIESLLAALNSEFGGRGTLPWRA